MLRLLYVCTLSPERKTSNLTGSQVITMIHIILDLAGLSPGMKFSLSLDVLGHSRFYVLDVWLD